MTRIPGDSWTDERVAELKRLAGRGFSCSEIGDKLGVTRNAVIGKLTRLGIENRNHQQSRPPRRPRRSRKAGPKLNLSRLISLCDAIEDATEFTDLPPEDVTAGLSFFEAGDGHCRWPLTDPTPIYDFRFCGAPQLAGCSYCRRHYRMGRQEPQTRARERSERRVA